MLDIGEKILLPEIFEPESAYLKNMEVLWHRCPELAQQVDRVDELDFALCEQARHGGLTCRVLGGKGEPIYLHSKYDPIRESQKWVDGVLEQAANQQQQDEGWVAMCYVVDGFGLGYHVKELYQRLTGDAFIVVSEPNMALLRTAMEHFDYSEMLDSKRIIFITKANRQEIFKKMELRSASMMMGVVFTRPLQRFEADFHRQVHTLMSEYASYMRSMLITLLGNSVMTCKNILHNLPAYVTTPSVQMLKNRFYKNPAVVVSAGPSLRNNLEYLKTIRDRVVVIAVQTTLKPLLAAGIKPDFVTSLDYHRASKRFFEGLEAEDLKDVHLVAEPKANWHVIDYYIGRGPVTLLDNEIASMVLKDNAFPHGGLPAGTTVAHLAFYLAQYIGADPILFIGQDLAFTGNVYYSPGNALHAVWKPELNRFFSIEMKEWERIARARSILRKVHDVHGRPLYTDEQMFTYLQQFEKDFARCSARVIDTSVGGVKKHGCQSMSLSEAAEQFCTTPIDREKFAYRDQVVWFRPEHLERGLEFVRTCIDQVEELKGIVEETIEVVIDMLELVDNQPALNKKMPHLDELRTMVKQRLGIYQLVSRVSQNAELFRFRQDRTIEVQNKQGPDLQRQQLKRDIGYVSEIRRGCDRLLELLNECVERFDERIEMTSDEEITVR